MARYIGPKTKISRKFGELLYGEDKYFDRRKFPPGQHGLRRGRKLSPYAIQLKEKQKAKYIYGILERQFYNMYKKATRAKGDTGEILLQYCEQRLDNVVYRLGFSPTRAGARQLVSHGHITVNGEKVNIPSYKLRNEDVVGFREKSKHLDAVTQSLEKSEKRYEWLSLNLQEREGTFSRVPEREEIPERIQENLIVELYSK